VHGYFVVGPDGLHHAEEFDTPIPVTDGTPVVLILKFLVRNP